MDIYQKHAKRLWWKYYKQYRKRGYSSEDAREDAIHKTEFEIIKRMGAMLHYDIEYKERKMP